MGNKRGFTVLELMVGIIIFTLGFLGAYMLVNAASNVSVRSRDEIIGSNIMREQIELLKNLRDTNWIQFRDWNSIELAKKSTETDTKLVPDTFYTIENDYRPSKTTHINKLSSFSLTQAAVIQEFQKNPSAIRLCLDSLGRYVHDCTATNKKTNYASFFRVEQLKTGTITVDRAYKITVYFVSFNKGYRLTSMSTIITDWKNQ